MFSNILYVLRKNSEIINNLTKININIPQKTVNNSIFRNNFLPTFNKAKLINEEIANMDCAKRVQLYEIARQYIKGNLSIKSEKNSSIEDDFSAIFDQLTIMKEGFYNGCLNPRDSVFLSSA